MLPARAPPHAQKKVKRKFKSQQFLSFFCIWKREQGAPDAHGIFWEGDEIRGWVLQQGFKRAFNWDRKMAHYVSFRVLVNGPGSSTGATTTSRNLASSQPQTVNP